MSYLQRFFLVAVLGFFTPLTQGAEETPAAGKLGASAEYRLSFDDLASGTLPESWKIEATHPGGKLSEWKVTADKHAPSAPNILAITKIHDDSSDVFNLCWTNAVLFQDGAIEVSLRADTGKEDQGGGVIWRAKDANNYYIARYNPLESNFRIYYVKNGRRTQLASAGGIDVPAGEWFRLRIAHQGTRIEGYLNGRKYLEATDETFMESGGVGFWSKADAASSFDDLLVVMAARN